MTRHEQSSRNLCCTGAAAREDCPLSFHPQPSLYGSQGQTNPLSIPQHFPTCRTRDTDWGFSSSHRAKYPCCCRDTTQFRRSHHIALSRWYLVRHTPIALLSASL